MRRPAMWTLIAALAALASMPEAAAAQEEDEPAEVERQEVRTVTVRPDGGALFVAGRRAGWLGVRVDDVDRAAADSLGLDRVRGARILEVEDDSPAAGIGLETGDVVVAFDGEPVRSVAGLIRLVRETPPGREVELRAVRDGSDRTFAVTVGERPGGALGLPDVPGMRRLELRRHLDDLPEGLSGERMERLREHLERAEEGRADAMRRLHEHLRDGDGFRFQVGGGPRLGVRLESLTDQLADYFGVGDRGGALVASVVEGSPAETAGLRAGDVVVSFGDRDVEDVGDLMAAVREAEAGPVTVTVVRRGDERSLTVELPERPGDDRVGGASTSRAGVAPPAPPVADVRAAPPPPAPPAPAAAPSAPGTVIL